MDSNTVICVAILICIIILTGPYIWALIYNAYKRNPFDSFPQIQIQIDISGKKNVDYYDFIDQWILDNQTFDFFEASGWQFRLWVNDCEQRLDRTHIWKKHRREQFKESYRAFEKLNHPVFVFQFYRKQTRYRQVNYHRYSYIVQITENSEYLTANQLHDIKNELKAINFELTRNKYFAKNQRKLMTKKLRKAIMERDNYTCQICGKYMPDEVGLQIDHVIPVKKGGKTVPSNLRVTCSKCNQHKGSKTDI